MVPASRMLLIPLGFIIWAIAFITLYATNAIGCEFGWDEGVQRGVLIAISLGFLGVSGLSLWLVWRHWQDQAKHEMAPAPSIALVSIYGSGSAFVAMIGLAIPVLATTMCI